MSHVTISSTTLNRCARKPLIQIHRSVTQPGHAFKPSTMNRRRYRYVWHKICGVLSIAILKRVKLTCVRLTRAKLGKRAKLSRAKLVRVKLARVKKDAPNWNDTNEMCRSFDTFKRLRFSLASISMPSNTRDRRCIKRFKATSWSTIPYAHISNHSSDPYQIFSSCCLCQMKAKLKFSVHLHMGNYVNQVHHTINMGESREVNIKNNFA